MKFFIRLLLKNLPEILQWILEQLENEEAPVPPPGAASATAAPQTTCDDELQRLRDVIDNSLGPTHTAGPPAV